MSTTTTSVDDDDNARPLLPTVLILGGLNTVARHLVVYLLLGVENGRQEKEVGEEGKDRGRVKVRRGVKRARFEVGAGTLRAKNKGGASGEGHAGLNGPGSFVRPP